MTSQVPGKVTMATVDLRTSGSDYDNGYQEQPGNYDDGYREQPPDNARGETYIPEPLLPAMQPPPPPSSTQPIMR